MRRVGLGFKRGPEHDGHSFYGTQAKRATWTPMCFMAPRPVHDVNEMQAQGYIENWVCYKSHDFSAKELTIFPGQTVTIKDSAAYGIIVMQGHGKMGVWDIETPALIRYGQLTNDEFFISEAAAKDGVKIVNNSDTDPIVILKHFGPRNPDLVL